MSNIIEIKGLNKSFKDVKAVRDLSLKVREGELFAFLGVNGAGKSTTINIICGQLAKDSGSVIIDGCDIENRLDEVKGKLGVVFQSSVLDKSLSVKDNLESRAALYGIHGEEFEARLAELCELLPGITEESADAVCDLERYRQLKALGLSTEEAYRATARQRAADTRSHLSGAVGNAAPPRRGGISEQELRSARELLGDISDAEIRRLYKRVNA